MSEPIKTEKQDGPGRPEVAEDQYYKWLDEMRLFLRQGQSLWYAMDKCGILKHKDSIYKKYREDKEFAEKIDKLQATVVELNNAVIFKTVEEVHNRLVEAPKLGISPQEAKIIALVAEKHRGSQPFYATRTETAEAKDKDFGKVINELPTIEYVLPEAPAEPAAPKAQDGQPNQTPESKPAEPAATGQIQPNPQTAPSVAPANG